MYHSTFIPYKYSDARKLRDKIINAMGGAATYYRGETSDSPNLSDEKTDSIKKKLKDQIFHTSVSIIIVSMEMIQSKWINWEIEYALKEEKRSRNVSHSNGLVGVIQNDKWGQTTWFDNSYLYDIILENRNNKKVKFDQSGSLTGIKYEKSDLINSYISLIGESDFLENPNFYIDNAYEKSLKTNDYYIVKYSQVDHDRQK